MKFLLNLFTGVKLSLPIGFFLVIFGLLMVIVIPNFSNIQEKLGFETKSSLQKQAVEDKNTILDLQHSNDVNLDLIDKNKESQQAALDSVTDHNAKVIENQKFVDEVKKKVTKQLSTPDEETPVESSTVSATVEINAIWDVYCKFNKDNECSPNS